MHTVVLLTVQCPHYVCEKLSADTSSVFCLLTVQACALRRAPCKSPMTLLPMQPSLVPNHSLRSMIREWQEQQQQ